MVWSSYTAEDLLPMLTTHCCLEYCLTPQPIVPHCSIVTNPVGKKGATTGESKIINSCVEKVGDKEYKLAVTNPYLIELKTQFEKDESMRGVVHRPTFLAKTIWGANWEDAVASGQVWITDDDPNTAHWREGHDNNTSGGVERLEFGGQKEVGRGNG